MSSVSQARCNVPIECNTFVFMDLETTGLDPPVRITEIHLCAVEKSQFLQGTLKTTPRVYNSLNLCINPTRDIHPQATTISKLDNANLEHQSEFNEDVFHNIFSFLNQLKRPICLVAHNGFKFDFLIFKAEIAKLGKELPDDILCADSLEILRHQPHLLPPSNTTESPSKKRKGNPSLSLPNVYKRCFGHEPPVSHQAQGDVLALLYSAMFMGDNFLKALDENAKPLTDIKKRW